MGQLTKIFKMKPWLGGMNTSLDPSIIEPNELVQADNVIISSRQSKLVREGIYYDWDSATAATADIIGITQFSYGTTGRTSVLVAVDTDGKIYKYTSGGTRSTLTDDGTAYGSAITKASFCVFNNKLIICVDGATNKVKYWDGSSNVNDVSGAPLASFCRTHLGRLWLNDKTNIDRVHYSETGDETKWNGSGDSGALDFGAGDGDATGVTSIFPSYHGDLVIGKSQSLYRVQGQFPETFSISQISRGIGVLSHNSVVSVDGKDIFFVSHRGIHSLSVTDTYGDLENKYISAKIQKTFVENFTVGVLKYVWGGYIPELQSVAFTFQDTDFGSTYMNTLYFYNIEYGIWYRWTAVPCQSMCVAVDSDRTRMYLGGINNKVAKTQTSDYNDVDATGADVAVYMYLKTGVIYPENEHLVKGFKKLSIHFLPDADHYIETVFKIDNYPGQYIYFNEQVSGDKLGTSFVLGTSVLGRDLTSAPYTQSVDGYGRGFQLTITHRAVDQIAEIQGFSVEYEGAGTAQEVIVP